MWTRWTTHRLRITAILEVDKFYPDTIGKTEHLLVSLRAQPNALDWSMMRQDLASFCLRDWPSGNLRQVQGAYSTRVSEQNGMAKSRNLRFTLATSVRHGRPLMSIPRPSEIAR